MTNDDDPQSLSAAATAAATAAVGQNGSNGTSSANTSSNSNTKKKVTNAAATSDQGTPVAIRIASVRKKKVSSSSSSAAVAAAAAAVASKGSPATPKSLPSPSKKSQQGSPSPSPSPSPAKRRYSGGPNHTLSENVSKYLNDWAQDHITNPYPNNDDRQEIIDATGLTKERVLHWFKNFRSRHWDREQYGGTQKSPRSPPSSTTPNGKKKKTKKTTSKRATQSSASENNNNQNGGSSSSGRKVAAAASSSSKATGKKSPTRSLFPDNDTTQVNNKKKMKTPKSKSKTPAAKKSNGQEKMGSVLEGVGSTISTLKRGVEAIRSAKGDGIDSPSSPTKKKQKKKSTVTTTIAKNPAKGKTKNMVKKTTSSSSPSLKVTTSGSANEKSKKGGKRPPGSAASLGKLKDPPNYGKADSLAPLVNSTTASPTKSDHGEGSTGRWTHEEHDAFLKGLEVHGKKWTEIAALVKTRTPTQCRTHAQKHFLKVGQQQGPSKLSPTPPKKKTDKKPGDNKRPTKSAETSRKDAAKSSTAKPKKKKKKKYEGETPPSTSNDKNKIPGPDENDNDDESEEDDDACCLCHCGVDCSDRALFFPKDRKKELKDTDGDYFYNIDDPYLPESCYDRNNALVFCDTCNRMYHQKCHFVPLLVLPRGEWNCLVCSMKNSGGDTRPKKSQSPKSNKNSKSSDSDQNRQKFFTRNSVTDEIFQSLPPTVKDTNRSARKELEKDFELASAPFKAKLWDKQLKAVRNYLRAQASNMRLADSALATLTTTRRNRQHFASKNAKSQELFQTLVSLSRAKVNIRQAILSLETLRTRDDPVAFSVLVPWVEDNPQFLANVFPHGVNLWKTDRRMIPRTEERELGKEPTPSSGSCKRGVPGEILVCDDKSKNNTKARSKVPNPKHPPGKTQKNKAKDSASGNHVKIGEKLDAQDDSSGVSLTNLQCCVCKVGDASDDNDLILCDGEDCHRAFHMNCVHPAVSASELENEDEDWFCPLCSGISNLIHEMQALCVGEAARGDDDDEDHASIESWDHAKDIFPEAEGEFETSTKLLRGKRNEDTQRLLANYLGDEFETKTKNQMPVGSDSEDENDYSLFDEESFEERRRREYNDEGSEGDDTSHSSHVTLGELSSIELEVDKSELAALSDNSDDDDSDEDEDENQSISSNEGRQQSRRSRRLKKKNQSEEDSASESNDDALGADFSENNILEGKRKRKRVDYRKLNDALFGDLSKAQQGQLDDAEDFKARSPPNQRKRSKASGSSQHQQRKQNDDEQDDEEEINASDEENEDDSSGEEDEDEEESGDDDDDDSGSEKDDENESEDE
eukprot:CAMPEP_0113522260 /NCGR_PEP_ID=MMETSP0014_2-20120614/45098_1 /TAXON_ID=2857 /ORGANISM="Nitzschia sp." /LENGTH=1314 /DNA_ID=CAMNT_0000420313 /DNA_START=121 /DNA_END=4065 /DNA_ORIENTATION=- /assembly_acc=CAM_ASM_000159